MPRNIGFQEAFGPLVIPFIQNSPDGKIGAMIP